MKRFRVTALLNSSTLAPQLTVPPDVEELVSESAISTILGEPHLPIACIQFEHVAQVDVIDFLSSAEAVSCFLKSHLIPAAIFKLGSAMSF